MNTLNNWLDDLKSLVAEIECTEYQDCLTKEAEKSSDSFEYSELYEYVDSYEFYLAEWDREHDITDVEF